jgi:hypothetical protein
MAHTMKIEAFILRAMKTVSYNAERKKKFHQLGRYVLQQLVAELQFTAGSYEIRHNQAGLAVSGEIILHHDNLYVQFSQSAVAGCFMWRTCKSRRDYTGDMNIWATWERLRDLPALAKEMHAAIADMKAVPYVLPPIEDCMPAIS